MNKAILVLLVFVFGVAALIGFAAFTNDTKNASSLETSAPPPLPPGQTDDVEAIELANAMSYSAQLRGMTQQFDRLESEMKNYIRQSNRNIAAEIENQIKYELPKIRDSLEKEAQKRHESTVIPLTQSNRVLDPKESMHSEDSDPVLAGLGFNGSEKLPFDKLSDINNYPDKTSIPAKKKTEYVKVSAWSPNRAGLSALPVQPRSNRVLNKSINHPSRKDTGASSARDQKDQPIPYYTIENTATLFSNTTMTALMGVVPTKDNALKNLMRFKIITGADNIASNGLDLPDIKNIVWTGYAVGIREASCIQATVDTITYTFQDGTISTYSKKSSSDSEGLRISQGLGYLSDRWGKPCIKGRLITNAPQYLRDRLIAAGASAAAAASAATETTIIKDSAGGVSSAVTGDANDFILGKTGTGTLNELADYLRDRMDQAIDIIYLEAGVDVTLHVEEEIPIDYNPSGRKLAHNQKRTQLTKHYLD